MGRYWARRWVTMGLLGMCAAGCGERSAPQPTSPTQVSKASEQTAAPEREDQADLQMAHKRTDDSDPPGVTSAPAGEALAEATPQSEPEAPRRAAYARAPRRRAEEHAIRGRVRARKAEGAANAGIGGLRGTGRGGGGQGAAMRSGSAMGTVGTLGRSAGSGSGYGRGAAYAPVASLPAPPPVDREAYQHTPEASFFNVSDQPLSTFSVDVDTASYSNVRRLLHERRLPPADAVRVEEMLNYFDYSYGKPKGDGPFAIHTEVSDCPWNEAHRLVHVGLETQAIDDAHTPARNLVFLLDVSGSMRSSDKLPLLKQGMAMLARNLRPEDTLSIVVYAGASGLALEPTAGDRTGRILSTLERLEAGGSTAGAAGIQLAYQVARQQFVKGGINRVILATDGDFNVGISSQGELARLIEEKRESGIFLTVLGFGRGNLQDARMETLADKGNGNYAYIDSAAEARKVLVREAGSTLVTVAKDVKLQVEFNPAHVQSYRLIGYENRTLAARDFNDDKKDAGEVGAGHSVTALYEVVPAGAPAAGGSVDPLRYQSGRNPTDAADNGELMTLKVRYKHPDGARSRLIEHPVRDAHRALESTSDDFRFAAAVAGFGLKLRKSEHVGDLSTRRLRAMAARALGDDPHGDRRGLLELIDLATQLGLDG